MSRLVIALLLVLAGLAAVLMPAAGSGPCPGLNVPLTPYSSETITVSSTAVALSSAAYMSGGRPPLMAVVNNKDYPVVYNDVEAPTATAGTTAHAAALLVVCGQSVGKVQFIREGASDSRIFVRYYRGP